MPNPSTSASREGLLYGVAAYACWGLVVPLYFKAVSWVGPLELLAQRILWSVAVLVGLLVVAGRWKELRKAVRSPRTLLLLGAGSVLIGVNWLIYIYSVVTDQMVESGLGYFILPLVSVLFGMLFLGERLRRGQWLAMGLAGLGVVNLAVRTETVPWIALALAGAFGLYGLLRKLATVESLISLLVETAILAPFAAAWMGWRMQHGGTAWASAGWGPDLVLALSGVVTAFPLLWFGKAARLLPLTTLSFIQYLSPILQCALAVWVFGEPFTTVQLGTFLCVWLALVLFSVDLARARRAHAADANEPESEAIYSTPSG